MSPTRTKVHDDGPGGIRVPFRQVDQTNGERLRLYDTSGEVWQG